MQRSENIDLLAKALSKAQGEIKNAKKDAVNDHFKKSYDDLASSWDACRASISKYGLSVIQTVAYLVDGWVLETTLLHDSGQFITGIHPLVPERPGPHAFKSVVTYAKRTSLEAMVGIAGEDDDGNAATNLTQVKQKEAIKNFAPKPVNQPIKNPLQTNRENSKDVSEFEIGFGKFKGMKLSGLDIIDLESYIRYIEDTALKDGKEIKGKVKEFLERSSEYLLTVYPKESHTEFMEQEVKF